MQLTHEQEERTSYIHERLLMVLRRKLPRRDRMFLVLHYLQGLNPEEIAAVMDCPVSEVEGSITSSMALVNEQLHDTVDVPGE